MSLYNMIFGINPFSGIFLDMIGVNPNVVPRYRDCYLTEDNQIAIHTRTGGGNRDFYEDEATCREHYPDYFDGEDEPPTGPWNADLRRVPGYISDSDDDFDATYAYFLFAVPSEYTEIARRMGRLGGVQNPSERWRDLFAAIGIQTPSKGEQQTPNKGEQFAPDVPAILAEAMALYDLLGPMSDSDPIIMRSREIVHQMIVSIREFLAEQK